MASIEIASEIPLWIVYIFYIIIIALATVTVAGAAVNPDLDLEEVAFNVYKNRILFSPSCLVHEEERIHPGIVSLDKFDESSLKNCFPIDTFAARLNLHYKDGSENGKTVVSYVNRDIYDKGKPICFSSRFYCTTESHYVLVADKLGKLYPATLRYEMVLEA